MPYRQQAITERRGHINRAAPATEACGCRRSLVDVPPRKTGLLVPSMRWSRRCECGLVHYYGNAKG